MNKIKENIVVLGIIVLTIIMILLFQAVGFQSYSRYSTDTLHYEKASVVEVSSEELEYDEELGMYLGSQELEVEMLDGEEKGEIISVTNYLTKTHSVYAEEGTKIIISADRPEGTEPYYSVYNYDRTLAYVSSLLILAAAIICIGKGKGVKAILGPAYSLFLIVYLVLPAVFSGYSPTVMSILCAVLSTAVTLLLLNGQSKKTYVGHVDGAEMLDATLSIYLDGVFYQSYDIKADALPINVRIPVEGKKQIKFFIKDGRSVAMYSTTIGFADMLIR